MDVYELDTLVIGAGVVGLAVAKMVSEAGRDVWIVEQHNSFGVETSSRNSEVIHAGIYYPQESLKARFCVEGKALLYQYCRDKSIAHRRLGKLIVAADSDQAEALQKIQHKAELNGVDDLEVLESGQVNRLEPALAAEAALLSPSTGIVDSHALMQSLLHGAQLSGAQWVPSTEVRFRGIEQNFFVLELIGQDALIRARKVVNAAGLYAPWLLRGQDWFPQSLVPKPSFAKGNYFSYSGKVPFQHLIYPVPEPGGLGVHLTLDLSGAGKFGPDVEWVDVQNERDLLEFDYSVQESRKTAFAEKVRSYWPELDSERLAPAYSGLRPKLQGFSPSDADFCIQGRHEHGVPGLVNLFGIESPGLTSCLAIARHVTTLLD